MQILLEICLLIICSYNYGLVMFLSCIYTFVDRDGSSKLNPKFVQVQTSC